jgi:hypothetical protein
MDCERTFYGCFVTMKQQDILKNWKHTTLWQKENYWWPGLRLFVKNYVKGCRICQQFKIDRSPSHPAFVPRQWHG